MSNLPPRPQDIIVEKWLPYRPQKRRVVYQRSATAQSIVPRNLIIEWEAPDVEVVKQCKDLGVVDADPEDYMRRYGGSLLQRHELPSCECGKREVSSPPPQASSNITTVNFCSSGDSRTPPPNFQYEIGQPRTIMSVSGATIRAASSTASSNNRCQVHFGGDSRSDVNIAHFEVPELEGDVGALKLVDLERHGLQQ